MTVINHKAKEATVTDLREIQATMQKLTDNDVKTTVTPTGGRKVVVGHACDEYRIDMTVPASVDRTPPMTVTTTGPFCIVKDAPGRADYAAFSLKAADSGSPSSPETRDRPRPGRDRPRA